MAEQSVTGAARTHDYSQPMWGHAVNVMQVHDGGQRLDVMGHGHGVSVGDFLILANRGETTRYRVGTIRYLGDPPDMWKGELVFAPRSGDRSDTHRTDDRAPTVQIPMLPPDCGVEIVLESSEYDRTHTVRMTFTHAAVLRTHRTHLLAQELQRKMARSPSVNPLDILTFAKWVLMTHMGGYEGADIGDASDTDHVREAGSNA